VLLTVVTLHVPSAAPDPFVVTAMASASNPSPDDVLLSTSVVPTVLSTGCSSTAGGPTLLGLVLLLLLVPQSPGRRL